MNKSAVRGLQPLSPDMSTHQTTACVLTSRGMAAISSITLAGKAAKEILEEVFRPGNDTAKQSLTVPPSNSIVHGVIVDKEQVIDEVVVGCESENTFVIHCHGNPLLVEQIVKLLQSLGAVLTDAENFAAALVQSNSKTTIEAEAKLAMRKSATLLGVKILQAQIDGGLSAWAHTCLNSLDTMSPEEIHQQCIEILERGKIAKRIIDGVHIVIAGPPNSGKSTLLNCLAGQQQVVVSEMAGTTRDWVSVTCRVGPLNVEFIDTAGLDAALANNDSVERAAQDMTGQLLASCDLVLYVRDITQPPTAPYPIDKPVIHVANKCDLIGKSPAGGSGDPHVTISAKDMIGLDLLTHRIIDTLQVEGIRPGDPIVFTSRQSALLETLLQGPENAWKTRFHELLSSASA